MEEIGSWLKEIGLEQLTGLFEANDIDLRVLPDLTDADLRELGLSLGHRRRILRAVAERRTAAGTTPAPQRPARGAERRQVTVMFCDLVGSTALSGLLDPEDLRDVMRAYQERCTAIIHRYEGHIGNYVGDGILAYFGYPIAHEHDAQQAVQAALAITEAVAELGVSLNLHGIELAVRVGIETGLVIAGDIGTGEVRDHMAIVGETPNIAARLQHLAAPGTVLLGPTAQRLVEGLFEVEDRGRQVIRGAQPVPICRVVRPSGAPSRFEARAARGLTPMVGREEELRLLLARWQRAREGEGHLVLLSGEAGIGKSRLISGFREALHEQPHTAIRLFCSPFYAKSALHPLLDHLERAAGLKRDDPLGTRLDKLEDLLARGSGDPAAAAQVLAPLMGIPTGDRYPPLDLTPEARKARSFDMLSEQVAGLAKCQPLLMIVEDVHWIDPTSLELFHRILDQARRLPVMILMTHRPDLEPPFADRPEVTTLRLTRLGRREVEALVARVSGNRRLPRELLDGIVARTDGVPLFVEELTKTVIESGLLEDRGDRYELTGPLPSLAIPASLHDSLMARLDRLAPVKDLAQLAATLGRSFSEELIEAVAQLTSADLERALHQLIEAELLYRRGTPPSVVYDFKHALVLEVAYASLLRSRRQELHQRIATVLETRFPETATSRPELLVHHFREAGLPERALPYALRAGDDAAERYARTEARLRFEEALELTAALSDPVAARRGRIEAALKLASVASNREQFERDLARLESLQDTTEATDRRAQADLHYWRGRLNYVLGRFDLGVEHARAALAIADELDEGDARSAPPVNLLARLHCLRGEATQAIRHAERSVAQMARLGNRLEEAAVLGVLAFAYGMHGDFEPAFAAAGRGLERARALDHLPTIAACCQFVAVVRGWQGDLEAAVPAFEEALVAADQAGDLFRRYLAHGWRGEAYLLAGATGPAAVDLDECLQLGDQIGTSFHRGAFEAFRARLRLLEGRADRALELARRALTRADESGQDWSRSIALRVLAEALLATGAPPAQAVEAARSAMVLQEAMGCRLELARSLMVLARALQAGGGPSAEPLARAQALFAQMGLRLPPALARQAGPLATNPS